ncbi:glycosyltransferase [Gemmobacter sp. 24YEA27]|uniref:glycosyltransferase n=1 Tax=Gemmobacter sp. 24YEA27 TaxID=3040672 RepID=UPI0024B37903|nr:glycosyltransferase [Gemmobacter sp. 24YEA27]
MAAVKTLLATDSAAPSGVGRVMLTLATALTREWRPGLLFGDHMEGHDLVRQAADLGLQAGTVPENDWRTAVAGASLVHVHAGIGWEGHGICAAARRAGATVIRTEHLPWLITDPGQVADYAQMLGNVDAITTVGEAAGKSWHAAIGGMRGIDLPVITIPNGITPPAGAPNVSQGQIILCVARFTPQKNHSVLIDGMHRLRHSHPAARLQLVGSGPEEQAICDQLRQLGLTSVELLGQRDDVPTLIAGAAIVVLPSAFEGLPLFVLEAMAAHRAVVASRIGGNIDALGPDHPWLVSPGDPIALAAALATALDQPERREEVAAQQADRFRHLFTARHMADRTAGLYAQTRDRRKRTGPAMTRLAFIGAGGIAQRHFGVLAQMPDVCIVAVADPDLARAEEAAQRLDARAFEDHATMLAEVDVDAVYICVPPFAHGDAERACIARGLPFFVEKPLSLDLALAEAIAAEVAAASLITAVGYHWRYLDTVDEARAQLAGNPAHLMTGFWLDQTPPPEWWWREDASGGQIVEQATHVIDMARCLAGEVTEVSAMTARRDRPDFAGLTVPTATAATLRFASGAVATLASTCLLRWNHGVALHVFADALAMEITDHDLMIDVGHGRPARRAEGDPVWREDRAFIDAVQGGENRIRCPYAQALETHRVALAVQQSALTGAPVQMEVLRANPQPFFRRVVA